MVSDDELRRVSTALDWIEQEYYKLVHENRSYHSEGACCLVCGCGEINTYFDEPALCSYHDTSPDGI